MRCYSGWPDLPPPRGRDGGDRRPAGRGVRAAEANYEYLLTVAKYKYLFTVAKTLHQDWHSITLNMARDANSPVTAVIDTGSGGQPQDRIQYLLDRDTGAVTKTSTFADGSLGQRLRTFVRFGHTGEFGGLPGQAIAALASLGACVLVYSGLSLSIRRLAASLKRKRETGILARERTTEQSAA